MFKLPTAQRGGIQDEDVLCDLSSPITSEILGVHVMRSRAQKWSINTRTVRYAQVWHIASPLKKAQVH